MVGGRRLGLVPRRVGAAVDVDGVPGGARQLPDVGEADRALRAALLEATDALPTSTSPAGGPRWPTS